ncbi:hypothetical protein Tco_0732656 [Tanacetum coccineum]
MSRECSVAKIPLKFVIKKRKQPNPETPILIAEEIDLDNVIEAQILSYMWVKISQEVEAQENVKLVEQHMLDKDVNKLVEGKESVANQFADDMIRSQEDPDIRIDPGSQKEIRKMVKVTKYVAINEEEEEETAKAELIQKKRKGSLEIRDTPLATPTRSPRTETLSLDKDVLKELMTSKPTASKVSSSKSTPKNLRHLQGALACISKCHGHMLQNTRNTFLPKSNVKTLLKKIGTYKCRS